MTVRTLSKELQEVAIKELNEEPKRISEDIAHIKEWLSKQPHLNARTDDQILLTFLRGCKFSLERTKEKIDMHYTMRSIIPEMFNKRDPFNPAIQKILSLGVMLPLPKSDSPAGPRYYFARNSLVDKHKLNQADVFKVTTMLQDILLLEDDTPAISGCVMIQDMADLSMSYFLSLSPVLIKKAMMAFQQAYPVRIKALKFFNVNSIFEKVSTLFKPFLSEKLKNRMGIFTSFADLSKDVPLDVLPEEYGGNGGKLDEIASYWKSKIESYKDWFAEDQKYRNDEKKRPGKPKTTESVFGVEGSFRQLAVD